MPPTFSSADLVAVRPGEKPYVTPGKPDESFLYQRLALRRDGKGDMPPRGALERPSDADKAVIRKWIEAGAPDFPQEEARTFIPLLSVLSAIHDDISRAAPGDRRFLRYFTLTHLHNNPSVRGAHLRLVRAALAKALNSLSWQGDVVLPRVVDPAQTVLAIDIRKLGWTRGHWEAVLHAYPYGLSYNSHDDVNLKDVDDKVGLLSKGATALIHVRADWFIATATRPPLYHALLYDLYLPELKKRSADPKLPANPKRMTALDLEEYLKVDVSANLLASDRLRDGPASPTARCPVRTA